jgi:ribosomal protein S18 acetylase RimI-like enzyme
MERMEIRPATIDDASAVRQLARNAWHETYGEVLDDDTIDDTIDEWYADDALADALDRPGTAFLVAETDDGQVGFCHGVCDGASGYVLRLYVEPDHQGQGVGTGLHEHLRDDLRDLNMRRMYAMVLADNDGGNEFYREMGFEKTSEGVVELGGDRYTENVYKLSLQ